MYYGHTDQIKSSLEDEIRSLKPKQSSSTDSEALHIVDVLELKFVVISYSRVL